VESPQQKTIVFLDIKKQQPHPLLLSEGEGSPKKLLFWLRKIIVFAGT
jgi:hypothetical protein